MTHRTTIHYRATRIAGGGPRQPISIEPGPAWMSDGRRACAPGRGKAGLFTSDDKAERGQAARLCRSHCPFLAQCRTRAVEHAEVHHVWGGEDFAKEAVQLKAKAERDARQPSEPAKPKGGKPGRKPADPAVLDAEVRELYDLDLSDQTIALRLSRSTNTVSRCRRRMHLASKFGPGGKRLPVSA